MSEAITLRSVIDGNARIPVSIEPVENEGFLRRMLRRGAAGGAAKGFRDVIAKTFGNEGVQGYDPDTTRVSGRIDADGRSTVVIVPSDGPSLELHRPGPDTYEFSMAEGGIRKRCVAEGGRRTVLELLTGNPE